MDYASALLWDGKANRLKEDRQNELNAPRTRCPSSIHHMVIISLFRTSSLRVTPSFFPEPSSMSLCLLPSGLLSPMSYPPLQWLTKTFDTRRCRIKTSSQIPAERAFPSHLFRAHTCHLQPHQSPDGTSLQQHLSARPSVMRTGRWIQFHPHSLLHAPCLDSPLKPLPPFQCKPEKLHQLIADRVLHHPSSSISWKKTVFCLVTDSPMRHAVHASRRWSTSLASPSNIRSLC